ncbi:MAG: DUF21 domain-containing protein [Gammaproteobacteria bacterium]|nr:DUF21 domain-containing protein [Gammaproteobacteria bacterium]
MILLITYLLIAILFSFYCSVAEAVLLSINKPYILLLKKKGKKSGDMLFEFKQHINRPLSAILTLNTIAHTVGAAGVGAQAIKIWGDASIAIVSAILTILILVFSEIIPKTLGAYYWRQLASIIAYTLNPLIWLLTPIINLSDLITSQIGGKKKVHTYTRNEISAIAELGEKEGALEPQESEILKNLILLRDTPVHEIMTPRPVFFSLPLSLSVGEFFINYDDNHFSRILIYDHEPDKIIGFVLRSDLLLAQARGNDDSLLRNYERHLSTINSESSVLNAYEILLSKREKILLLINDYGSPAGLISLEDILETLLGKEIIDERDKTIDLQKLAVKKWNKRKEKIGFKSSEE